MFLNKINQNKFTIKYILKKGFNDKDEGQKSCVSRQIKEVI